MNLLSLKSIFTASALIVTAGVAAATNITEIKTYQSTLSTDANGPLDLKMEANYNDAVTNAPLMVMLHQYSNSTELFNQVRPNAQSVRDQGFFVITVAMRGRMSSDGTRDSGGLEIYDIYDAVEAAKTQYGGLIDPTNINITGYSGGGGNTMSALTKFPDLFRTGGAFYGMSDYGYDLSNGWYNNGAASNHRAQLDSDIGNPNGATALITSRHMARASNLASRNNPYSEIHFFVNSDEPTCPLVNDTSYRNKAIAAAGFPGEFNNITLHTGIAGTYQDFNGNSINEVNEQQYWPHSTLPPDQQQAGIAWYLSRVLNGSIPAPVLNASDNLFVAGFVRTKKFSFFVGDGQNGAASLTYSLSPGAKDFTYHLLSPYAVTGKLTVDTADMSGQTVNVLRNGAFFATFTGGGTYQLTGIANHETVRLVVPGTAPALTENIKARYAFEGNEQDTSGNGLAATATALSYTTGKVGAQAAQFNGTSSNVSIPSAVTDDFTVAMWVKTTDTAGSAGGQWWSGKALVDGEMPGGAADWGTAIVNGKFVLGVGSSGGDVTLVSSVNVNDGTWHHVLATRNATTGATAVYVDGVLRGSGTGPTGTRSAPTGLRIGSNLAGSGAFLNGALDDVRLYDWALTATEITALASGANPAAPTGAVATPGNGSVTLGWTAPSTATGYYVQRATTNGGPYTTVAAVTGASYLDAGLSNGTTYYYVVSAANTYGEGANSAETSTVPSASGTPPSAPTGLVAAPGDASVTLSWTAPPSATGYHVKRATTSGGPYTIVATPTSAFYLDTGLSNGTTYYYVVTAMNTFGESANSTEASAAPVAPVPADLTVDTVGTLNGNGRTILEATGNSLNVTTFASNIATAFASDGGGVWNFDGTSFNILSGGTIALKYGTSHTKSLVLTLTEGAGATGINQGSVPGEATSGSFALGLSGNVATRTFALSKPLLTVGIFNTDRNDASRIPVLTVTYQNGATASTSGANADNVHFHGLSGTAANSIVSFAISQNNFVRYDDLGFIVVPQSDSDGDGLLDTWEIQYFGNLTTTDGDLTGIPDDDQDDDGMTDQQEHDNGTNPTITDTDGDGLSDGVETNTGSWGGASSTGTSPTNPDSDGDGFNDKVEVDRGSDPNNAADVPKRSTVAVINPDAGTNGQTVVDSPANVGNANFLTLSSMGALMTTEFANDNGGVINWNAAQGWDVPAASFDVAYGAGNSRALTISLAASADPGAPTTFGPGSGGGTTPTSGSTFLAFSGGTGAGTPVTFNSSKGLSAWGITQLSRPGDRTVTMSFTLADASVITYAADTVTNSSNTLKWYGIQASAMNPIMSVAITSNGFVRYDDMAFVVAPLLVQSAGFNGPNFEVTVRNLSPGRTYVLKRGTDLIGFPDEVETIANPTATHTFTDPNPPAVKAFYRVEER